MKTKLSKPDKISRKGCVINFGEDFAEINSLSPYKASVWADGYCGSVLRQTATAHLYATVPLYNCIVL